VLSDAEKSSIERSIATLRERLSGYFNSELSEQFQFGSSTRGTILPRNMDSRSDIDYMIVFSDSRYEPQTYLDKIKRFAQRFYSTSDIKQSSPTVVLELNHIRFDLVPALQNYSGYKIIGRLKHWVNTNPNEFNTSLTNKNKSESFMIKPTIRLAKFWNAKNDYTFESHEFEKWIVGLNFYGCQNQTQYLFKVFDSLQTSAANAESVECAKKIIERVRGYEKNGYLISAEREIKRLIP